MFVDPSAGRRIVRVVDRPDCWAMVGCRRGFGILPGNGRNAFDRGGDLSHQLFGSRGRVHGEFGQMDHRDQLADPGQGSHQISVRLPAHLRPGE